MVSACLLLGVKLVDVWTVLRAHAAGAQPQTESHPQPPAKSEPAAPHGAPARGAAAAPAAPAAPSVDPAQADSSSPDPLLMSPEEIDLLQKLAARRIELEKRAQDISQQEVLLKAAEQRIDDKISKLSTIENGISVKVQQKEQEDAERIKGLVKIYETMKPGEAARIFAGLDMTVLLDVLDHMKERKVAAILASLEPDRAKQITMALAVRHQQQAPDAAAAAPAKQASTP
jgi:flagellar motility protein MotE (MotC chaperone)